MSNGKGRCGRVFGLVVAAVLVSQSGCAVTQKPGKGYCSLLTEPSTHTGYWLYLPEDYVKNKGRNPSGDRWPLVVTFHGLRPYDNANMQIREWQEESDRYNFIVIAPELRTCDSLYMQFPLQNPELPYVKADEVGVLAVMDEVIRRTDADPSRVLATSFSSGGYIAHFMVNRHPERFTCLAVRGSNFNENLLNPGQIPKYRNMKVGIFFGENDFKICADESMHAVEWYRQRRFDVVAQKVGGLGHERKPEVAAALFANTIGVSPKTPPDLGLLVMKEVLPAGDFRPRREPTPAPRTLAYPDLVPDKQSATFSPSPPSSPTPVAARTPRPAVHAAPVPQKAPSTTTVVPRHVETPKRRVGQSDADAGGKTAPRSPERTRPPTVFSRREEAGTPPIPAGIRVHGESVGRAPMWVNLSVNMPEQYKDGVSVLWTDNDRPIPALNSLEAQALLKEPGEHEIEAHVITADDRRMVLRQKINVLGPTTRPAS